MGRNAVKRRVGKNEIVNRSGGVAFDINDPATKLITMTGGSFFMEPRYYNSDTCIPVRNAKGVLGKLEERLKIAKDTALSGSKAIKLSNCDELDSVSLEIMAAAWDILNGDNPSDLLKIAHWLRRDMYIRLTPQVLLTLASQHPEGQKFVREYTPKIVSRPDEIKTVILMHRFFFGMKNIKNCLSRGLADTMAEIGERGLFKYEGKGFPSWKDVLFMVHRKKDFPLTKEQYEFFTHGKIDEEKTPVAYAREKLAKCSNFGIEAKKYVKDSFANWEVVLSQFGQNDKSKKEVWEYLIDTKLVGYMACFSEDTPIWMPDGTTSSIKDVVKKKNKVLSFDKEWDTRSVNYERNQLPRDMSSGNLIETKPVEWIDGGKQLVKKITFVSGRFLEATNDHRWITRRKKGIQSWEWKITDELKIGDQIPSLNGCEFWGDIGNFEEGYFIGAMLGDGGMTACTPEFSAHEKSLSMVEYLRTFVAGMGCDTNVSWVKDKTSKYRFTDKRYKKNAIIDFLRKYNIWGLRCEKKMLPNMSFSRDFWRGCLSGLIDTDGCVRMRKNNKDIFHASIEFASVSEELARQVSDGFVRLGISNIVRKKKIQKNKEIKSNYPLWIVEINSVDAIRNSKIELSLKVIYKQIELDNAVSILSGQKGKKSGNSWKTSYDNAITIDKVKSIEVIGKKKVYCVNVEPSNLFIANGIITGNCMRNLRNLLEAGVSNKTIDQVCGYLSNENAVKNSRQLPFRFAMAREVIDPSNHYGFGGYNSNPVNGNSKHKKQILEALEDAVDVSSLNVPELPGTTVVFADNSGSMDSHVSNKSNVTCAMAANILSGIIAKRSENAHILAFGTAPCEVNFTKNTHVLDFVTKIPKADTKGMSTNAHLCIEWMINNDIKADRVILLSDMQCYTSGGYGCNSGAFSDNWSKYIKKNPDAWLHSVDLNGYGDSVVNGSNANVNLVGGFSEKILTTLLTTEGVTEDALPTLDQIREQW